MSMAVLVLKISYSKAKTCTWRQDEEKAQLYERMGTLLCCGVEDGGRFKGKSEIIAKIIGADDMASCSVLWLWWIALASRATTTPTCIMTGSTHGDAGRNGNTTTFSGRRLRILGMEKDPIEILFYYSLDNVKW